MEGEEEEEKEEEGTRGLVIFRERLLRKNKKNKSSGEKLPPRLIVKRLICQRDVSAASVTS